MHGSKKELVFAICYPVLASIGIPANLVVIAILSRGQCGLSRCITNYLVSMAATDFLVMMTAVVLNRIPGIYFPVSFLSITPVCSLRSVLIYASMDSSVWLTVSFTFDRFVAICCQKFKAKYCTIKSSFRIICTICAISCLKASFLYFIYEPSYVINNIPWFCRIKSIFYTSPVWIVYDWILRILSPFLPIALILLLNFLTVRHIVVTSRARKRLRAHNNGVNQSDPEMEKRRKSMVLLFAISGSFLLLYLLDIVTFLYVQIVGATYFSGANSKESSFILEETGLFLQFFCSCINPFIYAGTQNKLRTELMKGVKFPLTKVIKLFQSM